jgi:hypothetical protein
MRIKEIQGGAAKQWLSVLLAEERCSPQMDANFNGYLPMEKSTEESSAVDQGTFLKIMIVMTGVAIAEPKLDIFITGAVT